MQGGQIWFESVFRQERLSFHYSCSFLISAQEGAIMSIAVSIGSAQGLDGREAAYRLLTRLWIDLGQLVFLWISFYFSRVSNPICVSRSF